MINNIPFDKMKNLTPYDPITQDQRKTSRSRTTDLTVALQAPPEVITTSLDVGDKTPVQQAKQISGDAVQNQFNRSLVNQEDTETAALSLEEARAKQDSHTLNDDFYLESGLTVDDPEYSAAQHRIEVNRQIAFETMSESFTADDEDKGFWSKSVDFFDYMVRDLTIGTYEALVKQDESEGLLLIQAAATMEPNEFKKYIKGYVEKKKQQGFLTSDNYFAYLDGIFELENSGVDPMAGAWQLLALTGIGELAVRPALRATTAISRVGRIKGRTGATEAAEAISKTSLKDDPELQAATLPNLTDPKGAVIRPAASSMDANAQGNKIVEEIIYLNESGTFGRVATPEQVQDAGQRFATQLKENSGQSVLDVVVDDVTGLGDNTVFVTVGRQNGKPFIKESRAKAKQQTLADKGYSTRLVQEPDGWVVQVSQRLDLTKSTGELQKQQGNAITNFVGQFLGSTRTVDDEINNTLALMGESGQSAIRAIVDPYIKTVQAVGLDSRATIGMIFKELRDGPDAYLRAMYTPDEFKSKFKQYHPKGQAPTEKDMEAFYALQTMSDAGYILQGNRIASRYVSKGYKTIDVTGHGTIPARAVKPPQNELILNGSNGATVRTADLPENATVWRVDTELDSGFQYVYKPKTIREIEYQDVIGMNAGGPRKYKNANYFVTLGSRAVMTAFSEKQARLAVRQISNITNAVRQSGKKISELVNELDEVLEANKDWNLDVETTEDFVKFVKENGWDLAETPSFKGNNQVIEGEDVFAGMPMKDFVAIQRRRADKQLLEVGGAKAETYNPIQSIMDQLGSSAASYSFKNYNYRSKVSWLRTAGYGKQLDDGGSVEAIWANVDPTAISGAKGRELRRIKDVIDRRDAIQDPISSKMSDFGGEVAEWMFNNKAGKWPLSDLNVTGSLLNLGFRSAFGFLNIGQFFLQASQTSVIAAISPRHGLKAAIHTIPVRLMMFSKGPWKEDAIKYLSTSMDISVDDVRELEKYLKTSGRTLVEADAIEKGTGMGWSVTQWEGKDLRPSTTRKALHQVVKAGSKADKVGLIPFNEGERLGRYTSLITAFLERKAKYKGSVFTDEARQWLVKREQDLSFNMTNTSRGMWQSGLMKVPTQWMTYSMRAMENLVIGRGFTAAERLRMGVMFVGLGGTATIGLSSVADYLGEKFNLDPSGGAMTGLQYGMVDSILTYTLQGVTDQDVQTAFGTRISPFTLLSDIKDKATNDSFLSVVGGPSGEIVGGGISALITSVGAIFNGNKESALADLETALRTPSAIDNFVKAKQMMETGSYISKTGTALPADMREFTSVEALLQASGITNYNVAELYRNKSEVYKADKRFNSVRKELESDFNRALRMWEDDPERSAQLFREIEARIKTQGFSTQATMRMRNSLLRKNNKSVWELILKEAQKGNTYGAKRLDETLRGN